MELGGLYQEGKVFANLNLFQLRYSRSQKEHECMILFFYGFLLVALRSLREELALLQQELALVKEKNGH